MEETYRINALVLKRSLFRESDSKVIVYTRQRGKLELVARGTARPKSKLVAHIEPISLTEAMAVKGKQLDYVGSIVSRHSFPNIKKDLDTLTQVGRVIFLFDKLVKTGEVDEGLYELLLSFWLFVEENKSLDVKFFCSVFILKLLSLLGYEPDVYHCMNCNDSISPGDNYFDASRGGLVCGQCYDKSRVGRRLVPISDDAIKVIRFSLTANWLDLKKLKVCANLTEEFAGIVNVYLLEQT